MKTLRSYLHRLLFRFRNWRESRRFYREHGRVVSVRPNTPKSRRGA